MTVAGQIKEMSLRRPIERRVADYSRHSPQDDRLTFQLSRFNRVWEGISREVPYYANLVSSGRVPSRFASWRDFVEYMPVTSREQVQDLTGEMTDVSRKADFLRITGGTTTRPVRLPAWKSERKETDPDPWMARLWYGIHPSSRLFMIWGDRRQLNDGIKASIITALKKIKNRSLGLYRFSAYDLNNEKMRQAALAMLRHKPDYIYAYSMALDYFARVNAGMDAELGSLGLKAIIASAEGFPKENTRELLARLFGCPVVMEYGTVETGALAYSHPGLGYHVFWQNYFIEATEAGACGGQAVRVTTLYPRCFPLIRYEISDEIDRYPGDETLGLWRFRRVRGRSAFSITLDDGTIVHHLAIAHCISDLPGIAAWQVVRSPQGVKLLLVSDNGYSKRTERVIMERMGRIHPDLSGTEIRRVDRLEQTAAGKTPIIMDCSRNR